MTDLGQDPVPTWSVPELHEAVDGLLEYTFGSQVWIEGELRNVNRSSGGHVYFDLVEPGSDTSTGRAAPMLAVTLFSKQREQVNAYLRRVGSVRMEDGVRVRIRGELGIYPARSTLQLRMDWIDPDFTLGVMERARDRVLATLAAEELLERNARTPLAPVALHVALVTSIGSAAHADALDELRRSGLGIRVTVFDARTQGTDAASSLVGAITAAASLQGAGTNAVDVILVVRGGGARTDLAAFDTEAVARAIAAAPVPVWTGIGHEIDRTVADEVAHRSHKTPTAAAAAVVEHTRMAADDLAILAAALPIAVGGRLTRAQGSVEHLAERGGRAASHRLERESRGVDHLGERLASVAPRALRRESVALDELAARISPAAVRNLATTGAELDLFAAKVRSHDPAVALARGWTITTLADGSVVRGTQGIEVGTTLHTRVGDGVLVSDVVEVHHRGEATPSSAADDAGTDQETHP